MSTGSISRSATATFARRVAGTFGIRVVTAGGGLIAGIIIARTLGSAGVGVWSSINVMTLLAITVGSFGIPSAITFLVARDPARSRGVLLAAIGFAFVVGAVVTAAVSGAVFCRPELFGGIPSNLVIIAVFAIPFQMASYFCLGAFLGLERIRAYNLIDMTMQGLVLANACITLLMLRLGIAELVTFNTAANVVLSFMIIVMTFRATSDGLAGAGFVHDLRKLADHGSRFFVALAAGVVILRGDLLIVNYFRGAEEAGVYAVATQASIFLHMIPNVISTILFPKTSGAADETGELTCRVTRAAVPIVGLLCLLAVPASILLPLLYGQSFADVPRLFLILLPGVFLLGIETIQVQHFSGMGLPRRIPLYWLITMAINIGLNLLLVPRLGAAGAAIVSTISYALIFVLVSLYFKARTGRTFADMFIVRRDEIGQLAAKVRSTSPAEISG